MVGDINYWFSSDFHLNHKNIAGPNISSWKSGYRDFHSLDEMNETILKGINENVKPKDVLFFLGDFCFKDHKLTRDWRMKISCENIIWIGGNHDHHAWKYSSSFMLSPNNNTIDIQGVKITPNNTATVLVNEQNIFLSHYKHAIWEGSHKGYWHLYGHSHASAEDWKIGKSMDVGIDNAYKILGEYKPFNFFEIKELMDNKEIYFGDHHDINTNIK